MKTIITGNFEITFPNAIAYLHDNILIRVKNLANLPVGAEIRVTDLSSNQYRKLKYLSELNEIVFTLNDSIKSLYHDAMSFNITMRLFENGLYKSAYGFYIDILNGRTLPLRRHGSTRTIYAYDEDDLNKVGFVFPASGNLSVNGNVFPIVSGGYRSLDLRPYITNAGDYQLCFQAGAKGEGSSAESIVKIVNVDSVSPFAAIAQLQFTDTSGDIPSGDKGGSIWKDDQFNLGNYCINMIYNSVCDDFNFLKVRYLDTDGVMRYLGGKIKDETIESKGENFYRMDISTPIRDISRRYLTECADTVKVAYSDLRRDSYWNDILLANKVEFLNYNGEWFECSVKTSKVTVTSEETQDVELEFEILKG